MADESTRSKRYSEEFRLQATKLIVGGGTSYHQAAQQLGVSDWALRCWVKAFGASGHLPPKRRFVTTTNSNHAEPITVSSTRLACSESSWSVKA